MVTIEETLIKNKQELRDTRKNMGEAGNVPYFENYSSRLIVDTVNIISERKWYSESFVVGRSILGSEKPFNGSHNDDTGSFYDTEFSGTALQLVAGSFAGSWISGINNDPFTGSYTGTGSWIDTASCNYREFHYDTSIFFDLTIASTDLTTLESIYCPTGIGSVDLSNYTSLREKNIRIKIEFGGVGSIDDMRLTWKPSLLGDYSASSIHTEDKIHDIYEEVFDGSSGSVYSVISTADTDLPSTYLANIDFASGRHGVVSSALTDVNVEYIDQVPAGTATVAYIASNGADLGSATFVGSRATFSPSVSLVEDGVYSLTVDAVSQFETGYGSAVFSPPFSGTYLTVESDTPADNQMKGIALVGVSIDSTGSSSFGENGSIVLLNSDYAQSDDFRDTEIQLTNLNRFRLAVYTGSNSVSNDLNNITGSVSADNGTTWHGINIGRNKTGKELTITTGLGSLPLWRLNSAYAGSLTISKVIIDYRGENYTN